jgi:hypothetical protein
MQDLGIKEEPKYEADDGPLTEEQLKQIQELADKDLPTGEVIAKDELFPQVKDPHPPGWMWADAPQATYPDNEIDVEEFAQAKQTAKEEVISQTAKEETIAETLAIKAVGNNDYVDIDGKRIHHKAFDPGSTNATDAVNRYTKSLPVQYRNCRQNPNNQKMMAIYGYLSLTAPGPMPVQWINLIWDCLPTMHLSLPPVKCVGLEPASLTTAAKATCSLE